MSSPQRPYPAIRRPPAGTGERASDRSPAAHSLESSVSKVEVGRHVYEEAWLRRICLRVMGSQTVRRYQRLSPSVHTTPYGKWRASRSASPQRCLQRVPDVDRPVAPMFPEATRPSPDLLCSGRSATTARITVPSPAPRRGRMAGGVSLPSRGQAATMQTLRLRAPPGEACGRERCARDVATGVRA